MPADALVGHPDRLAAELLRSGEQPLDVDLIEVHEIRLSAPIATLWLTSASVRAGPAAAFVLLGPVTCTAATDVSVADPIRETVRLSSEASSRETQRASIEAKHTLSRAVEREPAGP
jgi:hypothetical protein